MEEPEPSSRTSPLESLARGIEPVPPLGEVERLDPPALVVRGLSKSYADTRALIDLSFEVRPGEVLGLVGPNGAGKTTALRTIAGVLPLEKGQVTVCGHDIIGQDVEAKRCLGWVPDDPQPFDTLTVAEHLEFTAGLFRVSDWKERADSLLERFDLVQKRDALGGELSRGMRQKLAFACTWLPKPRLVLLDEPLSGLDPRGIRSARQAIEELALQGTALILSSHLLELIQALASRLLIVDHGRKVFDGTLDEARATLAPNDGSSLEEIFFAATGKSGEPEAPEATDAVTSE